MSKVIQVIKVEIPAYGKSGYFLAKHELDNVMGEIQSLLEDGNVGDELLLRHEEITQEKFDNLEEFTGW